MGFLSAGPYLAGAVMMMLLAHRSDRQVERKWHTVGTTALSGLFLLIAVLIGEARIGLTVVALTLSFACFYGCFGPSWALPSEALPAEVAGVGIAVINGLGNLGGFSGPLVFGAIRSASGSFAHALTLSGVLRIAAGAMLALLPPARAALRRGKAVAAE